MLKDQVFEFDSQTFEDNKETGKEDSFKNTIQELPIITYFISNNLSIFSKIIFEIKFFSKKLNSLLIKFLT